MIPSEESAPPGLIRRLTTIVGASHVLTDPAVTAGYVTDWTNRWSGHAAAVVRPGSTDEVAAVVAACADEDVAIVAQGGNTGLVDGSIPHDGEVVVSLRRLDHIHDVDEVSRRLDAGAGVTVAAAHQAAARHGLAFGVDLASRDTATLGGIVATNAGGIRVIRHGATRRQVMGVEAVLADGSILRRWTGLEKDNVGYDLPGLLAGSEGTLAVITRLLLRLVTPAARVQALLVGVPTLDAALRALDVVRRCGLTVEAAEYFGQRGLDLVCATANVRPPFSTMSPYYLLVEVSGGSDDDVHEVLSALSDDIDDGTVEAAPARRLWTHREGHTDAIFASSSTPVVKFDVSVPLSRLTEFETRLDEAVAEAAPEGQLITFGHIGEGNVHANVIDVPPVAAEPLTDAALQLVAELGGSISAEHGVGRAKLPWLGLSRTDVDLATMRAIKAAFDPRGLLNPGVLITGRRIRPTPDGGAHGSPEDGG